MAVPNVLNNDPITAAWGNAVADDVNTLTGGTAFPASPATGRRFFRTDRGIEYFWNGTRWLSMQLYREQIGSQRLLFGISASSPLGNMATWDGTYDMWIEAVDFFGNVSTTLSSTVYWTQLVAKITPGGVDTTLATQSYQGRTASTNYRDRVPVGAALGSGFPTLRWTATKVSTPGELFASAHLLYRLVG